jgi:type VI secretion system secreted protein Hcp
MAAEIFLKLEGPDVLGESVGFDHEKEIDCESISFGAHNPTDIASGTGAGAGKVSFAPLMITKTMDASTPSMFLKCCNGTHFEKAILVVREAGGEKPVEYLKYEFKTVFVSSIDWGMGAVKPIETVALDFAEAKLTYTSQDDTGAPKDVFEAGFNLKTNQPV